ncbi:MAG: hypothetical protein PHX18_01440 [Candidatus Gastranaerophilales bacterium]|nr:hypothetical protein [Candidatus Gastranaerophilales bacterium]
MINEYGQFNYEQDSNGAYSYFLEKFIDKAGKDASIAKIKDEILESDCSQEDPGIIEKAKVHLRNFINEK